MTPDEFLAQDINARALQLIGFYGGGSSVLKARFNKKLEKKRKQALRAYKNGTPFNVSFKIPMDRENFRFKLCVARLMLCYFKDYDGWEYRSDWAAKFWHEAKLLPLPPWDGVNQGKLFLMAEQGIGDEVMFASIVPDVLGRTRNLVIHCDERLVSVFTRSFGVRCIPRSRFPVHADVVINGPMKHEGSECWFTMGDLMRFFRKDLTDFPGRAYLIPDPNRILEYYRGCIGIGWGGRSGRWKPEQVICAAKKKYPNTRLVNLQYNDTHPDLEQPPIDLKEDVEGVLGLLSVLKRVVAPSGSVVHFAGSIGTGVDLILAPQGSGEVTEQLMWRWGHTITRSYWYPDVRIFRSLEDYRANG